MVKIINKNCLCSKEDWMNTLYIHIGTAKTGSSALQSFLRKNNKVLEEKGYCYPKFPFYYENVSKNRNGYFLRGEKLGNKGANFGECMNIVREAFEKCPNVILSDEGRSEEHTSVQSH